MTIVLNQANLNGIFHECGFNPEQQVFFAGALQNTDPIIDPKNYIGPTTVEGAREAEERGEVIGRPMGMGEFLAPLHAMLAARSDDPARTEDSLNEFWRDQPTTQGLIETGHLGVYTDQPFPNVFRSFGLTINNFAEEYRALVAEFGDPLFHQTLEKDGFERALNGFLARVRMGQTTIPQVKIRAAAPEIGGPAL